MKWLWHWDLHSVVQCHLATVWVAEIQLVTHISLERMHGLRTAWFWTYLHLKNLVRTKPGTGPEPGTGPHHSCVYSHSRSLWGFRSGQTKSIQVPEQQINTLKATTPTEDAFLLHLKRAALATLIDKSAHISKPDIPLCTEFGWSMDNGKTVPITSTKPAWPVSMNKTISCGCVKGCQKNCFCAKRAVPCYIGCCCQGLTTRCNRWSSVTAAVNQKTRYYY